MATRSLCAAIRRRLYGFACDLANPFTDSRRARFVEDMAAGLLIAGHVHLTKVARALSSGAEGVHAAEKRLSRHLGSAHWDMSPLHDRLLADSAAFVTDDTLIVADTTDLAKYYARKLEGLGTVTALCRGGPPALSPGAARAARPPGTHQAGRVWSLPALALLRSLRRGAAGEFVEGAAQRVGQLDERIHQHRPTALFPAPQGPDRHVCRAGKL